MPDPGVGYKINRDASADKRKKKRPAISGGSDADKKTLYIAARTSLYRIRVNTPGI
jgi:hypothetical protein